MKSNLSDMMCLDLYISSLNEEEYATTKSLITSPTKQSVNLMSWGIQDLFNDSTLVNDLNTLQSMANSLDWKNNFELILKDNSYESVVITNSNKKILWVNSGFKKMTGYNNEFALGKSPFFLQGEKTSNNTKERIRKKLLTNKPFKEVILNYKKDKTTYKCELKIFPLYTKDSTTHFLALEREVG